MNSELDLTAVERSSLPCVNFDDRTGNEMKMIRSTVLAVAFAASAVPSAAATLDQDNTAFTPQDSFLGIVTSTYSQSFTVGVSGVLNSISFLAREFRNSSLGLFFEVRNLAPSNIPSTAPADLLFSTTIADSAISSSFQTFTIDVSSANIAVTDGQLLSFIVGMNTPDNSNGSYTIGTGFAAPYSRGTRRCGSFADPRAFDFNCGLSADLWFQTTVAEASTPDPNPAPIPLPAGAWLMLSGLAGMYAVRRRKQV
ncbi:MAG: VPLPA-CTERM sorting domain-containing protein [Pseudomonadota bacterium]